MDLRTSDTTPLVIQTVTAPHVRGHIGMTLCPGRKGLSAEGACPNRDLERDLGTIKAFRPELVITLMEAHEFEALGVPQFEARVARSGIPWAFAPIADGRAPSAAFERQWIALGERARSALMRGGDVLLHCRAGLGRTGTVAAKLLVELGMAPDAAIAAVRAGRPNRIETAEQAAYVRKAVPLSAHR